VAVVWSKHSRCPGNVSIQWYPLDAMAIEECAAHPQQPLITRHANAYLDLHHRTVGLAAPVLEDFSGRR
jgi:hypothetical protein